MLNLENQATNYIRISEFMCSCLSGLDHSTIIMTNHSVLEPKEGYGFFLLKVMCICFVYQNSFPLILS